jgi:mannitol/fructose-specific phosphotransferase system IIA component (Ntr-type)
MRLRDFLAPSAISLDLQAKTKEAVLDELLGLLGVDERATGTLARLLRRREALGSTGVGKGIAIPHCRSLAVNRLRLAFGLHPQGVDYDAVDGRPVHIFFLIVAPPVEVANQYLQVLGRIAQFAQQADVAERLRSLSTPDQLLALLDEKGA